MSRQHEDYGLRWRERLDSCYLLAYTPYFHIFSNLTDLCTGNFCGTGFQYRDYLQFFYRVFYLSVTVPQELLILRSREEVDDEEMTLWMQEDNNIKYEQMLEPGYTQMLTGVSKGFCSVSTIAGESEKSDSVESMNDSSIDLSSTNRTEVSAVSWDRSISTKEKDSKNWRSSSWIQRKLDKANIVIVIVIIILLSLSWYCYRYHYIVIVIIVLLLLSLYCYRYHYIVIVIIILLLLSLSLIIRCQCQVICTLF